MRGSALALLLLALAGCAERWVRPATSAAEAAAARAACTAEAAAAVPPRMEPVVLEPARIARVPTCWIGRDGGRVCRWDDRLLPERRGEVDAALPARAAAAHRCMEGRGFVLRRGPVGE